MQEKIDDRFLEIIASAESIPDVLERSRRYRTIAGILSLEAVRSNNRAYIEEAKKIAHLVIDDPSKAFLEVVRAITRMKLKNKETFDESVKITECIDNDLDLSAALFEIAFAFGKYGIDKKDNEIYSNSIGLVHRIPMNTYRAKALRSLSKMMSGVDPNLSKELLEESIGILEKSQGIEIMYMISAFCDTAGVLADLNDKQSCIFLRKAAAMAGRIRNDFDRSAVLLKILETCFEIGTKFKNKKLLEEGEKIQPGITREYYKTIARGIMDR